MDAQNLLQHAPAIIGWVIAITSELSPLVTNRRIGGILDLVLQGARMAATMMAVKNSARGLTPNAPSEVPAIHLPKTTAAGRPPESTGDAADGSGLLSTTLPPAAPAERTTTMAVQFLDPAAGPTEPGDILAHGLTPKDLAIVRGLANLEGQHVTFALALEEAFSTYVQEQAAPGGFATSVQFLDASEQPAQAGDVILRGVPPKFLAVVRPLLTLQGQHLSAGVLIAAAFQIVMGLA